MKTARSKGQIVQVRVEKVSVESHPHTLDSALHSSELEITLRICWQILHGGLPTMVRTVPSNAQAACLTPTLTHLLQATHGAGTTWGACRNSEVHPGQEQSQCNHYKCAGKTQICSFHEKNNLFSLQG